MAVEMREDAGIPALFARFPGSSDRLDWLPLGTFPTPVEPLASPGGAGGTRALRGGLWIKRDDRSGARYGGNKVRKLEFLLARARREGATRLITAGAAGSHHALATTLYGRELGFEVTLVLFPQPDTPHVRRVLASHRALGAELRWVSRMEWVPAGLRLARRAHRGERVFTIAPGGSDPVGTLGFVSAGLELAAQIEAGAAPAPGSVHVAAGTLGTAAGLALGFALSGLVTRIRAIRVTSRLVAHRWALRRLVAGTARLLAGAGIEVPPTSAVLARVELCHDQIGAGYGRPTSEGAAAAAALHAAGIATEPTYTAKAAADFLAHRGATGTESGIESGSEPGGRSAKPAARAARVTGQAPDSASAPRLFWHTLSEVEPAVGGPEPDSARLPEP